MLDSIAQHAPDRPAVFADGAWQRYGDLTDRVARLANGLLARGLQAGQSIALLADNHRLHLELMLAAPTIGARFAPLNTRLSAGEQAAMLARIKPALLITDAEGALATEGAAVLSIAEAMRIDGPSLPPASTDPDAVALLLPTGGSSGTPKSACIPVRQVDANARNTIDAWHLSADDCAIQATPMFHAAVNVLTTPLLAAGGRVVIQPTFDAGAYLAAVAEHRATLMFMVPTMYRLLAEHADFAGADLSSVRFAVSGGAPCTDDIRAAFAAKGVPFRQGYGLTEVGVNCFYTNDALAQTRPETVGWPMPGLDIVLRDQDGDAVAPGHVGEITMAGDAVFSGYLAQPKETAEALRDGWLWTGDLASCDAEGVHTIVGRRKELFISGGENVYPPEVECALVRLDAVAGCAVLGVPDPRWGEVGLAAVVLRAGASSNHAALRTALSAELARYKIPKHFHFLPELPKTGAGKIDKPALRRAFDQQHASEETHAQTARA